MVASHKNMYDKRWYTPAYAPSLPKSTARQVSCRPTTSMPSASNIHRLLRCVSTASYHQLTVTAWLVSRTYTPRRIPRTPFTTQYLYLSIYLSIHIPSLYHYPYSASNHPNSTTHLFPPTTYAHPHRVSHPRLLHPYRHNVQLIMENSMYAHILLPRRTFFLFFFRKKKKFNCEGG